MLSKLCEYMPLHWVNYNINISLKNKYVYFENPKVACSSIKKTLIHAELGSDLYSRYDDKVHTPFYQSAFVKPFHLSSSQLEDIIMGGDFFKFTFSRDPYERSLSCYLEKILNKGSGYDQIEPFLTDVERFGSVTYERYLNIISNFSSYYMNSHFRPQFYQTFGDEVSMDFVGRFERFDEDFLHVLNEVGINSKYKENYMIHRVKTSEKASLYRSAVVDKLVQLIYMKDFEKFGYEY